MKDFFRHGFRPKFGSLSSYTVLLLLALLLAAPGIAAFAENPPVALDTSETLFTVLTAMNACGYDVELNESNPLRAQIRAEVESAVASSTELQQTRGTMCDLYSTHSNPDPARQLAQYVSLALYLTPPPALAMKTAKESDTPPDATAVDSIVPLLPKFYEQAGLHAIWLKHAAAYAALTRQYHDPVAKMLFDTEVYLKLPSAGYLGHNFEVILDPMGAPGETNARNYGADYYVIISPGLTGTELKTAQIRHTFLHYLLDPQALKYPGEFKRMEPLLMLVKGAPMDRSFKEDSSLLATECLIRAIETRMSFSPKDETERNNAVESAMEQGFVLTRYFYDQLALFEKGSMNFRLAYGAMLGDMDVPKQEKVAATVQFASTADPELLKTTRTAESNLLVTAQQRLAAGDPATAQKLAEEALADKNEDHGRALFLLAQIATMKRDLEGARGYFEQALGSTHETKVLAWSNIYLGRIFDLQEERGEALVHYRAALDVGSALPEVKAAAEKGIAAPYAPPHAPQPEQSQ